MIYLDNNSTTPCAPEAVAAMLPFLSRDFANPSSPHGMGRAAKAATEAAREHLAQLLGCTPRELLFTSGATESNNIALKGTIREQDRDQIVTSSVEHKSVLEPCACLSKRNVTVIHLPVDRQGLIPLEAAAKAITERTCLVSIQAANNETGTVQPIRELAEIAHQHGALFHCDATQMLSKLPISLAKAGIDLASFSGHKAYAPKGIGVLFVRAGLPKGRLMPLFAGGGQEQGVRPGTLNVPAIVGLGKAAELAASHLISDRKRLQRLHELFETTILASPLAATLNGNPHARLPGTISLTISGVPADMLIANMPEICISNGSACSAGTMSPSHVLLAMGLTRELAECTVRLSIGRYNTEAEILLAADELTRTALRLRTELG